MSVPAVMVVARVAMSAGAVAPSIAVSVTLAVVDLLNMPVVTGIVVRAE